MDAFMSGMRTSARMSRDAGTRAGGEHAGGGEHAAGGEPGAGGRVEGGGGGRGGGGGVPTRGGVGAGSRRARQVSPGVGRFAAGAAGAWGALCSPFAWGGGVGGGVGGGGGGG